MRTLKSHDEGPQPKGAQPDTPNNTSENTLSLLRVIAAVTVSGLMALGIPAGVQLGALSALLFIAAFVAATAATFAEDYLFGPHLTRWDEAAALMTLSMLVGWLADAVELSPPGG